MRRVETEDGGAVTGRPNGFSGLLLEEEEAKRQAVFKETLEKALRCSNCNEPVEGDECTLYDTPVTGLHNQRGED